MKNKIILLIMVIPLLFMLVVYGVGKTISVVVDIPVSGIQITSQHEDGLLSLDMAEYKGDFRLEAQVLPAEAKNRGYSITVDPVDSENAPISFTNDGTLVINDTGKAKVTVTSDERAFTDSIIVSVTSSKLINLYPSLTKDDVFNPEAVVLTPSTEEGVDYEATIKSGSYHMSVAMHPSNLSHSNLHWESDDENAIRVNALGEMKAMLSGTTYVTVSSPDGIHGNLEKKIKFNVETPSSITVNGGGNGGTVFVSNELLTSTMVLELPEGKTKDDLKIEGEGVTVDSVTTPFSKGNGVLVKLSFIDTKAKQVRFSVDGFSTFNAVNLSFRNFAFDLTSRTHLEYNKTNNGPDGWSINYMFQKVDSSVTYVVDEKVHLEGVTYNWTANNDNVTITNNNDGTASIKANKTGTTILTVRANGEQLDEPVYVQKTVTVVRPIMSIEFQENTKTHGIGNFLAVGDSRYNGKTLQRDRVSQKMLLTYGNGDVEGYAGKDIIFESSDETVAKPFLTIDDFKVDVVSTGTVTFTAKWKYGPYFGESVSSHITLTAVKDGVNVATYADLRTATEAKKPVVLTDNVMLGKKGATVSELESFATKMPTTYDWTFYANQGLERPTVYYLINFQNDLYGNGFEINGDYITRATDATGQPLLFKGPLDFVSARSMASVKAQDNIVFLVSGDNVTINNVSLKGCSDESLYNEGKFELSLLNYVGTTLEISSNATVKNCRISNGRTVTRVFGGDGSKPIVDSIDEVDVENERINVSIESSIMTMAREFLLKVGSNRAIKHNGNNNNLGVGKLTKANGGLYQPYDYNNNTDDYFYDTYVLTDVTLKNSVLASSGIFAIGMETHFAGEMLAGTGGISLDYWKNLAATALPSVLRMVGDVRILDWKNMANVDSSTLIETSNLTENLQFLKLDIAKMLESFAGTTGYEDIIDKKGEEYRVHSGIAMYGGGHNYSYVDFTNMTSEMFADYNVNLSILTKDATGNLRPETDPLYLQGSMLPMAAGGSDFKFYMYNTDSTLSYEKQQQLIESNEAYVVIPA